MPEFVSQTDLSIRSAFGQTVANLKLVERSPQTLLVLSDEEVSERGEEQVQLTEGFTYEFHLESKSIHRFRLRETSAIQPSRIANEIGRIEPGLATGLLPIILESVQGVEVGRTHVEVRTSKIDYHRDYRVMLDGIAEKCMGLLLDIHAPAQARLVSDPHSSLPSIHEKYAFIRALLSSREFRDAMQYIISDPHRRTISEETVVDIRQSRRPSRSLVTSVASGRHRIAVPADHPIHSSMKTAGLSAPSLPRWISTRQSFDTRDTPENRFVKHSLGEFQAVLFGMEDRLLESSNRAEQRLLGEVQSLRRSVGGYLETSLFQEVGPAVMLPLGSPVLQKRSGYREILKTWLQFSLATQLSWSGGQDVFGAGKKDVALLYEYWLFFVLIDVMDGIFQFDAPPMAKVIDQSSSGFDLKLRSGSAFSVVANYAAGNKSIHVRFGYNRTFSGVPPSPVGSYPKPGSWTRSMRPDYSLSFWPSELSEVEAELADRIVHVHFDAKYRVENIVGLFGTGTDADLEEEARSDRANTRAKRSDLLKMHSYRDAIRRTQGAYVLYPGSDSGDQSWIEFHEILPGLGAFSVRPGNEAQAKASLERFIRDILDHLLTKDPVHGAKVRSPGLA